MVVDMAVSVRKEQYQFGKISTSTRLGRSLLVPVREDQYQFHFGKSGQPVVLCIGFGLLADAVTG